MPSSSPPPDRFQREIDDIIRLAERRLERPSLRNRVRRTTRRFGGAMGGVGLRLPAAETMAGWALALLLLSWLIGLVWFLPLRGPLAFWAQVVGVGLLVAALVVSLTRGRGGGRGDKMWRGERIRYGSPYGGDSLLGRLRRILRGRP